MIEFFAHLNEHNNQKNYKEIEGKIKDKIRALKSHNFNRNVKTNAQSLFQK
jgi:hypothetical protein